MLLQLFLKGNNISIYKNTLLLFYHLKSLNSNIKNIKKMLIIWKSFIKFDWNLVESLLSSIDLESKDLKEHGNYINLIQILLIIYFK